MLHNAMMRVGDRLAAPIGLTSSRWLLLCRIGRASEPVTVGSLSHDALMSVQNASRMIVAMEREGLVRRCRRPGAGRAVFVELTEFGRTRLGQTVELARRFERALVGGLTPERRDQIHAGLECLIENLSTFEKEVPG